MGFEAGNGYCARRNARRKEELNFNNLPNGRARCFGKSLSPFPTCLPGPYPVCPSPTPMLPWPLKPIQRNVRFPHKPPPACEEFPHLCPWSIGRLVPPAPPLLFHFERRHQATSPVSMPVF